MAHMIISATLNLPYITPNPFKGTLQFSVKELVSTPEPAWSAVVMVVDVDSTKLEHGGIYGGPLRGLGVDVRQV